MYLLDNPVLQRELLVNLRMSRAFVLLMLYQVLLAGVVLLAWPQDTRLDLAGNPSAARDLVDLFFVGQYVLASLMAPSFAAGSITGEKERKTYEMLLASPLKPGAIVIGKLIASLTHLAILIFASLPIVMLCLPLGGVNLYELLAAYLGLIISVVTFGFISVACSSYFKRTVAALTVSYLLILPLTLLGVIAWIYLAGYGEFRLLVTVTVLPGVAVALCISLFFSTTARLLHPPDVGSEGQDVVDLEGESENAVGLVIRRDQFPDRLFAPEKRNDLIPDNVNPVYDKEVHSEIFSQGTLMLRLVIQISMVLAIFVMAICLYVVPQWAAWYIGYVLVFNLLVGPVFSAGSITNERERETLDLLLTTIVTPWQILWGKFVAGLRVSSVLTSFLLWPLLLACVMVSIYWSNLLVVATWLAIIVCGCLTSALVALFCSVLFRKTSHSLMASYITLIAIYFTPLAVNFFADNFFLVSEPRSTLEAIHTLREDGSSDAEIATKLNTNSGTTRTDERPWTAESVQEALDRERMHGWIDASGLLSPFTAVAALPLNIDYLAARDEVSFEQNWSLALGYLGLTILFDAMLFVSMIWLFNRRWRVAR